MKTFWIDEQEERIIQVSRRIWEYAELGLQERRSSAELQNFLKENGFHVETGFSGMETAFKAVWGNGKPVIGFLGEYDALPELSQKVGTDKAPVEAGAPGHGCGHNLLGTASAAAAIELRYRLEKEGKEGTVIFLGCPDEESSYGKIYLAEDGFFDELDVALTMHPGIANFVNEGIQSAIFVLEFEFHGTASHAAAAPWEGRSALDALEIMHVGVNYLREHVPEGVSMHYVVTNGGDKPNIVPQYASSRFMIRGKTVWQAEEVLERVLKVAEGAAVMTGTKMGHRVESKVYSFNVNEALARIAHDAMEECGPVRWTSKELAFAEKLQRRYDKSSIENSIENYVTAAGLSCLKDEVLHSGLTPYIGEPFYTRGSTDVSNVSWIVPTLEICTCCRPVGISAHTWEQTSCAGMSIGQKGMLHAARAMSLTAYKLIEKPELLRDVKEEFERQTEDTQYQSFSGVSSKQGRSKL